jgi:Fur family zinc uptake transcriptional regulator
VLDILWQDHRPLSAYHILDRLNSGAHGDRGRPAAPPTVYRALDFLVAEGLAHRLASLNAYVGCPRPEAAHGAQFFICRVCGAVAEVRDEAVSRDIAGAGAALGFTVVAPVVEVQGVCPNCRSADAADAATGEATS